MPYPRLRGRLTLGFLAELRDAFRAENVVLSLGGGILLAATLALPVLGPWLAAALLVVAAGWVYGQLLQDEGEGDRHLTAPEEGLSSDDEPAETGPAVARDLPVWGPPIVLRLVLGAAAAAALVAPACIRLGDRALPWFAGWGGSRWGMVFALVGWVVLPVLMLAGYARGPDDRPYPSRVASALVRLPFATLAALVPPFLGLVLIESLALLMALQQGQMRLLVNDVFPPPRILVGLGPTQCGYQYDNLRFTAPFPYEPTDAMPVYRKALGRGYTLTAAVPASVPDRLSSRFPADLFSGTPLGYFVFRLWLTVMIASVMLFLLGLQARWLGLIGVAAVMVPPFRERHTPESTAGTSPLPSPSSERAPTRASRPSSSAAASPALAPGVSPPPSQPNPMSLSAWGPSPVPVASTPPVHASSTPAAKSAATEGPPSTEGRAGPIASRPTGESGADSTIAKSPIRPPVSAPDSPARSQWVVGTAPRILVTEEESHLTEGLARALTARGFIPTVALDGMEVLRQARKDPPDLIVLDLRLPSANGLVVCQILRADPATHSVPILMMARHAGDAEEHAALAAGAVDFVRKPCQIDDLIARIGKLVRRAAPP